MKLTEDKIELLSVGIDVGSSTSHLVFSKLVLMRNEFSYSRRYEIVDRRVIYESDIVDTPLVNPTTVDIAPLVEFFRDQYKKAGIAKEDVDTGVVIVTGETAKKENAAEIIELIAKDAGDFVAATAGPNFESLIAAFGSGATIRSEEEKKTILSCDIGGGTANIAISKDGRVVETACISVGGRLIAYDANMKITRIDAPARKILNHLNMDYEIGDVIAMSDLNKIAEQFAQTMIDCLLQKNNNLVNELLMTENIEFPLDEIDEVAFSGGVGELIYSIEQNNYCDIGHLLANHIREKVKLLPFDLYEPENKIRATVIGAGSYTLQVSGSTCFLDEDSVEFPIRNIPIIEVEIDRNRLEKDYVIQQVKSAFKRFDIQEGQETVAMYFKDPVRAAYQNLKTFAIALAEAIPNTVKNNQPIILIFERDIGNSVGNVIRRETPIKDKLLSIDEIEVKEGDWIDIGAPLVNGQVVPVTVKSLVFSRAS